MFVLLGGVACVGIFLFSFVLDATRIPSPTATVSGIVIRYERGTGTRTSKQSDDCTYAYKVDGETYTLGSTCGVPGDRDGDRADIIYSIDDPQKAYVNRKGFFYLLGCMGIPALIIAVLLIRRAALMTDEE